MSTEMVRNAKTSKGQRRYHREVLVSAHVIQSSFFICKAAVGIQQQHQQQLALKEAGWRSAGGVQ